MLRNLFKITSKINKYRPIILRRYIFTTKNNHSPVRTGISLAFGKYLLLTNIASSGVLMLLGDICRQEIEYQEKKIPQRYDYGRLTRMFLVGLALGPIHHYFYVWIAKVMPDRSMWTITKKIMLDQLVMSPICIVVFFYGMGILESKPIPKCNEEIKNKYMGVYLMDWCVWPPTQFINFYYIPVKYQVFYINAVAVLYNIFLSYFKHKDINYKALSPIARCVSTTRHTKSPIRSGITLAFGKYLLLTNTISSGVLMLVGDICQQEIEYRQNKLPQRYDFGRMSRMFTVGFALGPFHHYFYIWLAKVLPARNVVTVMKKILIDQFIMGPICIVAFFYSMSALEMKPMVKWNEEVKNKFVEVYVMDWCVWPPTQFINFYYVPVKYQVFYINFITMLYNVFLSYIKHREEAQETARKLMLIDKKV
ncbi:hypothetical protein NQ315_002456 [Exocentrus adspersus]|uniref:Mpv17-like protein 2 n=1 Tax=Exocentrus adspersus TaxID=1586481 RepID=A0AAV8V8J8_9CUCU|nr:hypothetical protein NQ315_002456 [Exocentrus adspersus]